MKLYTFSQHNQWLTGIYQVIASSESNARELLLKDGHTLAHSESFYEVETTFTLDNIYHESIVFTLEVEKENYTG